MKNLFTLILICFTSYLYSQPNKEHDDFLDSLGQFYPQYILQELKKDKIVENLFSIIAKDPDFGNEIEKAHFYIIKLILEDVTNELEQYLSLEEKKAYKGLKLIIDSDPDIYFADMPVKVNKKEKTLTFKSRWFYGLLNYLHASNIEAIPEFNRGWFSAFYQWFKLTETIPNLTIEHAGLSNYQENELESFSKFSRIAGLWRHNLEFIYIHELSHVLHPEYTELQADSFAIEKLMSTLDANDEELDFIKSRFKEMGLPIELINSLDDVDLIKSMVCLNYTKTLDFIKNEISLNPIDYLEVTPEITNRLDNILSMVLEQIGCSEDPDKWPYCNQLIDKRKQLIGTPEIFEQTANFYFSIESKLKNLSLEKDEEKVIEIFEELNPQNPSYVFFIYGNYLLSKNYFDSSENYTQDAIQIYRIGASYFVKKGHTEEPEICNLMLAKTYENTLKNKAAAKMYYEMAQSFSAAFPKDFYENSIKKLDE